MEYGDVVVCCDSCVESVFFLLGCIFSVGIDFLEGDLNVGFCYKVG